MADTKLKLDIQAAITSFATKPLHLSALSLFAVLGYQSDRTLNIESVQDFSKQFDPDGKLNHPIALKLKWQSVQLLFQLSDEELSRHTPLFKDIIETVIAFANEPGLGGPPRVRPGERRARGRHNDDRCERRGLGRVRGASAGVGRGTRARGP